MKNTEICGYHSRCHTCSTWTPTDTRHTSIRFACPLPLWRERVVSLSSASSGCANLLLVESEFPDLFFSAISLGFVGFFTNTLDRLFWCFLSSGSFLYEFLVPCTNLHCCWRLFCELPHKCMLHSLVRLWSSILQHTKLLFSSSEGHLYICKDTNIQHIILACLNTCCQNEKKLNGNSLRYQLVNLYKNFNTQYIL